MHQSRPLRSRGIVFKALLNALHGGDKYDKSLLKPLNPGPFFVSWNSLPFAAAAAAAKKKKKKKKKKRKSTCIFFMVKKVFYSIQLNSKVNYHWLSQVIRKIKFEIDEALIYVCKAFGGKLRPQCQGLSEVKSRHLSPDMPPLGPEFQMPEISTHLKVEASLFQPCGYIVSDGLCRCLRKKCIA